MKKAFTFVELIFVIVVLGILAAVAIPKLTATREDAVAASFAYDLATALEDFGAYYTARGTLTTPAQMTNVNFKADNDTNLTTDGDSISFLDCITLFAKAIDSTSVNAITVNYSAAAATQRCQNVALAAKAVTNTVDKTIDSNKTFHFGGSHISLY